MATEAQAKSTDKKQSAGSKSGLLQTAEKDVKPVQLFLNKFNNDWVMNLSGIVAYNLLMSMLPIAIALLGILGLFLNPDVVNNITGQIAKAIPSSGSQSSGTQQALELALNQLHKDAGIIVVIAILLALFGGSRLFVTLEGILDLLYRVRPRPVIKQNLVALMMLVLFIVLIPIMVFAAAAPSFVLSVLGNSPLKNIPVIDSIVSPGGQIGVTIAGIVSGLIVAFVLFEAIYFIVPNQHISWRNSWRGAVVASILLNVFLVAFPFYVAHFLGGYAGQIGFAVILLIFFYYFAVILLLGAEVNAYIFEKVQPLPNDLVTFVSTMGGKLNRDIPSSEAPSHTNTAPT
ncbi:MAG: YihY/virulence factor BrkB family protein, partial [Chloroflexota bacterium]|nr:YihY/virulence factor BrkB family protein [Chloroflexota bacterium]